MLHLDLPVFCAAAILLLTASVCGEDWPGKNWNSKLTTDYDQWKPIQEVLGEFAQQAGGASVVCPDDKRILMVPLPAGLTLKEAFLLAASCCAYDVKIEDGKLSLTQSKHVGDWISAIGAESKRIDFDNVHGTLLVAHNRKIEPTPWVWYAPNQGLGVCNAWIIKKLLDQGIAVAMVDVGESSGSPKGRQIYQAFYEKLVKEHNLAKKAVLWPQSRGGLMLYNWAAEHADSVQAIGGIYMVCNLETWAAPRMAQVAGAYELKPEDLPAQLSKDNPLNRLEPLAKAHISMFLIHGDKDDVVPLEKNSAELVRRYQRLGGQAELMIIHGKGHEVVAEYFQCQPLAAFLIKQAKASIASRP